MAGDDEWDLTTPPPRPADPKQVRILAVGVRAKDSAEIEAREKEFLTTKRLGSGVSWPIPFFSKPDQKYPDLPTDPRELAGLAADLATYGITIEEWCELLKREDVP